MSFSLRFAPLSSQQAISGGINQTRNEARYVGQTMDEARPIVSCDVTACCERLQSCKLSTKPVRLAIR